MSERGKMIYRKRAALSGKIVEEVVHGVDQENPHYERNIRRNRRLAKRELTHRHRRMENEATRRLTEVEDDL